jgi:hypothetical protein
VRGAHSREVPAKRIIELAQRGERDSIPLCDDALAHIREQSSDGRRGASALITGGLLGFGISVPLRAHHAGAPKTLFDQ